MRGLLPIAITLVFQTVYIGFLGNAFLGVSGVEAAVVEPANVVKRSVWNSLAPRGSWPAHELVIRQVSSGNRTEDLYDFFAPNLPPTNCSVQCDIIWGAVSNCDFLSCLCTPQYGHEFERCVDCLAPNPTPSQVDYYQGILDEFQKNYCAGYNVPPLSITTSGGSGGTGVGNTSIPTVGPIPTAGVIPTPRTSPIVGGTNGGNEGGVPTGVPQLVNGALPTFPRVATAIITIGIVSLGLW